jgi:hypothetical protein
MPAIELPNGQSAIIYSKDEISERTVRNITRAFMKAAAIGGELFKNGADLTNNAQAATAMAGLSEEQQNDLVGYEPALIVGLLRSWTLGDLPTLESVLDLPQNTFKALAFACNTEFNRTDDFSPDGAIDPKAPTAE